jgi:hypothetical protein
MKSICLLAVVAVVGCSDGGDNLSGFAGTYTATYSGTWQNTTPNTLSGTNTDAATITVTDEAAGEVKLTWQVPPNPASGSIIFSYSGTTGTAKQGIGVGGNCFAGILNGNQQTNCCDTCTIVFNGNSFNQPNAGHYSGLTSTGVGYTGNYSGTWTGVRR